MSKHTEGPWRQKTLLSCGKWPVFIYAEYKNRRKEVSLAQVNLGSCQRIEAEANANLITAAPDLLEALELIVSDHDDDLSLGAKVFAKTAIKRAKGL